MSLRVNCGLKRRIRRAKEMKQSMESGSIIIIIIIESIRKRNEKTSLNKTHTHTQMDRIFFEGKYEYKYVLCIIMI